MSLHPGGASISRALGAERRRSPAPSSARRARGAGGRKDLVWKRGKAAREPGLVTSLSEQAQKQRRTRGGARGPDPRERPPGQKRLPTVYLGSLEQPELVPPLPGRAEQGGWTRCCVLGESGVRGCRGPETGTRAGLPTGQPGLQVRGPRARGASWRCPPGTWILLQLQMWVTRSPLQQLPGGSPSACLRTSRLWGSEGCTSRGPAPATALPSGAGRQRRTTAPEERSAPGSRQAESVVSRALLKPWGRHQSPSPAPNPGLTALGPAGGALEPRSHSDTVVVPATRAGSKEMGFPAPAVRPPALGTQQPASEEKEGP